MPDINILIESELRRLVPLDMDVIKCIEQGFIALAGGNVVMPPIMTLMVPDHNGEVCVKTAYVPGVDSFAVKMSPGFFNNPRLGLPSTSGLLVLFSSTTGVLEALLLDNGYLTDVRTAAAGAVAAKHLARANATDVCVIGAGVQARMQLRALTLVRPISRAIIWARDGDKAKATAASLRGELNIEVIASADIASALRLSDIVVTTTPSDRPLVMGDWLQPGSISPPWVQIRNIKLNLIQAVWPRRAATCPTVWHNAQLGANYAAQSRQACSLLIRVLAIWVISLQAKLGAANLPAISQLRT